MLFVITVHQVKMATFPSDEETNLATSARAVTQTGQSPEVFPLDVGVPTEAEQEIATPDESGNDAQ